MEDIKSQSILSSELTDLSRDSNYSERISEMKTEPSQAQILEEREIQEIQELLRKVDTLSAPSNKDILITKTKRLPAWKTNELDENV